MTFCSWYTLGSKLTGLMALHRATAVIVLAFGGASTVHAEVTCASLACLQDLSWYANKCTIYNADGDACLQAYITRTDGTFSPCSTRPTTPSGTSRTTTRRSTRAATRPRCAAHVRSSSSATQCDPRSRRRAAAVGSAVATAVGVAVAAGGGGVGDLAALGYVSIREEPEPTWCDDYSGTSQEECESKVLNNEVLANPRPGYRVCKYTGTTCTATGQPTLFCETSLPPSAAPSPPPSASPSSPPSASPSPPLASAVAATAVVGAITATVIGAVAATIGGAVAAAITLTIAAGRRRRVPLHLLAVRDLLASRATGCSL